jgi:hypothetical protein
MTSFTFRPGRRLFEEVARNLELHPTSKDLTSQMGWNVE